jgi:hypothetical protein
VPSIRPEPFVVELSGELTIRRITDLHLQVAEALRDHETVTARIADEATVDLSFIQLIESARRTAAEDGLVFNLDGPATGPLLQTLERGGFLAAADPGRREFWLQGPGDR